MKHKILFLAANPVGLEARELDREAHEIRGEILIASARDRFEFVPWLAAQPMDLLHALRQIKPSIVHFVGHDRADGIYLLTGDDGRPTRVTREALEATLGSAGESVQLVVLNGCATEELGRALCELVPVCVGASPPISDHAARMFSAGLDGALASGVSVTRACSQGRAAMLLKDAGDHAPVLYHRGDIDPGRSSSPTRSPHQRRLLSVRGRPRPRRGRGTYARQSSAAQGPHLRRRQSTRLGRGPSSELERREAHGGLPVQPARHEPHDGLPVQPARHGS